MAFPASAAADHPARDRRVEQLLDDSGATWTFVPALALSSIDRKKSLDNQARVAGRLNDDQVELYAEAYRNGSDFPAIIACAMGGEGGLVVADGNHRVAAADAATAKTHPAYVVDNPSALQFLALTYRANVVARHGLALGLKDRLHHAAHLVSVAGMTKSAAADVMGLPRKRLHEWMAARETENRLRLLGSPMPRRASDVDRLASVKSDAVLSELATAANVVRADELSTLVTEVNKARSEDEAVEKVRSAVAVRKQETAGLPHATPPRSAFSELVATANRLSKLPTKQQVELIPTDRRPALQARLRERVAALQEVIGWLDQQ